MTIFIYWAAGTICGTTSAWAAVYYLTTEVLPKQEKPCS